jgi:nitroreductase
MKRVFRILFLAALVFAVVGSGWSQTTRSLRLKQWFADNEHIWRTVNNGSWSKNPKDAPTDAELVEIMEIAGKAQNAVNWNEYFFIAVRDPEEQAAIVGTRWGAGCTSEGTVTILILADQVAAQADHKAKYEGYYMQTVWAYFDSGMASAFLSMAAYDLGYRTHFFGTMNGPSVGPMPGSYAYGTPKYDISRFVKGRNYMRGWGFPEKQVNYEVEGNCVLIGAIVVGKPNPSIDAISAVTKHGRPNNFAIWEPDANTPPLKK